MEIETTFIVNKRKVPVKLVYRNGQIWFYFRYNKTLIKEVKSMQGAKWHGFEDPPIKAWSVSDSQRNDFQIQFLQGKNPYAPYDVPLIELPDIERPLREHQKEMLAFFLTRKMCIIAGEMGTGKTLPWIEAIHYLNLPDYDVWYVGPRAGVTAVSRELIKWNSSIQPSMMTYEGLVKTMKKWQDGDAPPRCIFFDESSKLKNPTSQRSQAALHIANAIREEFGSDGYILEASGTPAPKHPTDWWHQSEVACPGFLKEGTVGKLKARLCLIEQRESFAGGVYPHILTWLDDENKCSVCGQYLTEGPHNINDPDYHPFQKSTNEVAYLHERLKGLVAVYLKKDCLDLPEKQYEIVKFKPTVEMINAAKLIKDRAARAVTALSLCRELSDGFQYQTTEDGRKTCPTCNGNKEIEAQVPKEAIDEMQPTKFTEEDFETKKILCDNCGGVGSVPKYTRTIDEVESPKDQGLIDELDAHSEIGRLVVWGGFTATIDRVIKIIHQQGWATLRVDGRGYHGEDAHGNAIDKNDLFDAMDASNPRQQELLEKYPRVCVVGHPKAGGMALTFTASPTAIFYSNDFDGEARPQAEDRIHRLGMDENRGATIKDFICLPTDKLVLENLKKKRKLQNMTLGELEDVFNET